MPEQKIEGRILGAPILEIASDEISEVVEVGHRDETESRVSGLVFMTYEQVRARIKDEMQMNW
ncbi:hypothetical protein ACFL2V_19910 [Pseudomonadota bacterium]